MRFVTQHPVVLAPMAGGPTTIELASAVTRSGGIALLAAGYLDVSRVRADIDELRARIGDMPFGVNLFVPGAPDADPADVAAYAARIGDDVLAVGATLGDPVWTDDGWTAKLELVRELGVPIVSFTFGCPPREVLDELRADGIECWVTVTSVLEARAAADAGADVLVVQGAEAGGHRGSFVDTDGEERLPLLDLLRAIGADADLPLVAAGGVASAGDTAAALAAGATLVQAGTAFLLADEAGTNALHRAAVASAGPTRFTRAFTGRTARAIENGFVRAHDADAPRGYPEIHALTAPMRAAARERGDAERVHCWAGTRHAEAIAAPAAVIVRALAGAPATP